MSLLPRTRDAHSDHLRKGQIVLRKEILAHLGLRPGQRIAIAKLPDGRVELRAARRAGAITDLFGALHRPDGPVLSIEDIGRITAEGGAGAK